MIDRLKALIRGAGKRAHVLAVGKLTEAKLANFSEIGAFVIVACAEGGGWLDARGAMQPIVTPFELECALLRWGGGGVIRILKICLFI
jgi:diphthamide biosynthesis protein 2